MQRSLAQLARWMGLNPEPAWEKLPVERLLLDSRQYHPGVASLFFALRGAHHDGHDYIAALEALGLRYFVCEERPEKAAPDSIFLVLDSSLKALQNLARGLRQDYPHPLIAITGSNGKTIVKEWLWQVLHRELNLWRSPKSYNSQVGVPLSLWGLEARHELGIFEAGISQPGEMSRLESILQPEGGIFTNIGSAHGQNFASLEAKIAEKLKLFRACRYLVYQKDGSQLAQYIEAWAADKPLRLLSWSRSDPSAELFAERLKPTQMRWHWQGESGLLSLPFSEDEAWENALHVFRLALALGQKAPDIAPAFAQLSPVEMRLEMKEGQGDSLIINDSYNSDLESLRLALHFLETHGKGRPLWLILSTMRDLPSPPAVLHQATSQLLQSLPLEQLISIGPHYQRYPLPKDTQQVHFASTEDFLAALERFDFSGKAVLLKGAREFRFERIAARLEQKRHQSVLEIQLNRLVDNLNYYREKLAPGVKIMAMVKAFAYGSGSVEVARVLQFHGVHYLGVAYADEGVSLRKAGIQVPIMVLNHEEDSWQRLIAYNLEPEIYNLRGLEAFATALTDQGYEGAYPIHIKLETGMNRLGFSASQIPALLARLADLAVLRVSSVFSHLAAADKRSEDPFSRQQIARFEAASSQLIAALDYPVQRHLCNSSGIEHFPAAHYEMVRLGIGLYGISSDPEARKHLQTVSRLKARISQVKQLAARETVSYGRLFRAERPMRIGIVSLGYADGFRRSLSEGRGKVVIQGQRFPTLGAVCMDMFMIDLKDSDIAEGAEVEIFGDQLSLYELAENMGTIPYEVLTGISQRVKRIYLMS